MVTTVASLFMSSLAITADKLKKLDLDSGILSPVIVIIMIYYVSKNGARNDVNGSDDQDS